MRLLLGTRVNKALLICLLIFRSSEPCQGIATAEDVEGNPTGLPEVAPYNRAEQPCIMGVLCDKAR